MADENLSFQIVFDEIEQLTQQVSRAGKSIAELGDFGRAAGAGIDVAASSAVEAAEAILRIDSAAQQASTAINELTQPREIAIDDSGIEAAFEASERLRAEIEEFAAPKAIAIDFSGLDEASRAFEESLAAAGNLRSEIEEFESARAAVDGVTDSVEKLGESMADTAIKADQSVGAIGGSFGKIGTSIASIGKAAAGAFLGVAAFASLKDIGDAIADSMKTAVKEFIEAEQATINLTAALGSLGQFSSENIATVRAFADEIARTTTFEDDAVVAAAALIAQLGRLSGTELTGATESAVQLSAVLGKDLTASALLLARAAAGSTEALSRYRFVVNESLGPAERFADIQRQIAERFGGRAQADLVTFGGSVLQLKKAWNELLESFGRTIAVFQPAINLLTAGLQKANDLLNIPPPRNFLDSAESLKAIESALKGVTLATEARAVAEARVKRGLDVTAPDFAGDAARKKALGAVGAAEIAVEFTVQGKNFEQITAMSARLEELRVEAARLGQIEVVAKIADLQKLIPIGPLLDPDTVEDIRITAAATEFLIDLIADAQSTAGVDSIQLVDTEDLRRQVTTTEELQERLSAALAAVRETVGRAAEPGAEDPAAHAFELFKSINAARQDFVKEFGALPAEMDAIVDEALGTLRQIIGEFRTINGLPPIELEIGIKIADPEAITAGIQTIVGDSLTRASAIKFDAIDVKGLQIIGTTAEEAQARLAELAAFTPNLTAAFVEMSTVAAGFASSLASGFEIAFQSIVDGTAKFKTVMQTIFKSLVDEVIRQLARIAALTAILFVINPGAGFAAALSRAIPVGKPTKGGPTKGTIPEPLPIEPVLDLIPFAPIPVMPTFDVAKFAPISVMPTFDIAPFAPIAVMPTFDIAPFAPIAVMPTFDVAQFAPIAVTPTFDVAQFAPIPVLPTFDIAKLQPAQFAQVDFRSAKLATPQFNVDQSSSLAFSRFLRSTRPPEPERPRRLDDQLRVQRIVPQINISATDGISVRRQLSAGALRRELDRTFRRGGR